MITTIFKFEWKQFIRSKGLVAALVIFSVIGLFCLQQGSVVYHFQQVAVDSALAKKQRSYNYVKQVFDTLKPIAEGMQEMQSPFSLEWQLRDVVAKDASPLTVLSVGQSDVYAPLLSGNFRGSIFNNQFDEFQNPEKLLAGNLDVSFFLLFLFPLFFIAVAYNARSADVEAGITPLLRTQAGGADRIVYYRVLFRWLVALVPVLIVLLASAAQLSAATNFLLVDWLQWWAVALLYICFWLLVVLSLQRFRLNSVINVMTLSGIWVLLLIAIPGLLNTWLNYRFPVTNKTEVAELRDFDFKAWDLPFEQHQAFLVRTYPAYKSRIFKDLADSVKFRSFGYALQVYKQERALYEKAAVVRQQRSKAEEQMFWLNPVGGVMRSFASISRTSIHHQHSFEQSVLAYREQKLNYLFEKLMAGTPFLKAEFEQMPRYKPVKADASVFQYLLPIILLSVLFLMTTAFGNRR
ncbi:MAG TPA: DUF3526 domain-containing protein [Lacibacter sp.]|nr:DUF3526 domain-containing protein [Lacibacter sp.]HMO87955.1 DUF3526 domain-containing protein [Lacibacter sp.]